MFDDKKKNDNLIELMNDEGVPEIINILIPDNDEESDNNTPFANELPLLPLKNTVLFPGVVFPITVNRDRSISLINDAQRKDRIIGVVAQKNEVLDYPLQEDLYPVGTVAEIMKMLRMPDGNITVIMRGRKRFSVKEIINEEPYLMARVDMIDEPKAKSDAELDATISAMKDLATQIVRLSPEIPSDANTMISNIKSNQFLVHFISSNLNIPVSDKQEILQTIDFKERALLVLKYLSKEKEVLELKNEIQSKAKFDIDKQQRDYFLHQQLRAIQEELGHETPDQEIANMRERAKAKKWSKVVEETFTKEINKLDRMNPAASEYSVLMNYLETILDLPWDEITVDDIDLKKAQKVLDEDHYGLEKIKERILEYLAVLKLKGDMKSPILCLYGPPGVGKTSLGKSIARAMGRKYTRMSLGGLHDEAEIRGHRKTYIGAMPGRIVQSIKKAASSNPVFILDEIDKIGNDFRGDPASALLEVLDPEQNSSFYDNYLELDYDLSRVLFVATANSLDTIQPALKDRLEIIDINGYLLEEKVEIAKKYLIPKQTEMHGLNAKQFKLTPKIIEHVIEYYTRESGVRTLEKRIAALARSKAKAAVAREKTTAEVSEADVEKVLGAKYFERDTFQDNDIAGVVTGLAWTPVGGDVLYVETKLSPGNGKLSLTGKLGEVMKESAITALTFLKSQYKEFDLNPHAFNKWDLHIHVPEGAVPKEGPSAGITMLTAMASAFTQRKIKPNIAMTGEITLRGVVLPVGGIQEKILAAKRYGITEIILSEMNRKDVLEVKEKYRKGLKFHYVKYMQDVIDIALLKQKISNAVNINEPEFDKEKKLAVKKK